MSERLLSDHIDHEVDRVIDSGASIEELVASAVGKMIEGAVMGLMVNLGHSVTHDPGECAAYGERLLMRCIEELK